jgi:NADH-quinone oxidoreductase subunit E
MYDMKPVGKYKLLLVLHQPALCPVRWRQCCRVHLQSWASPLAKRSADGKYTLLEGECLGACGDAPVLLVNNGHKMQLHDAWKQSTSCWRS